MSKDKRRPFKDKRQHFLIKLIKLPWKILLILLAGMTFTVLAEWVGMAFFWQDQGYKHAQNMLEQEISYLNDDFKTWMFAVSPALAASNLQRQSHRFLLDNLQFKTALKYSKNKFKWAFNAIAAALYSIQVFLVRVLISLFTIPAFLILGVIGFAEGLVQRDLRRMGGGLEHAFLYHIAKRGLKLPLVLSWLIYLSAPVSIHPTWVFVPGAVWFGLGIMWTSSLFKKYL